MAKKKSIAVLSSASGGGAGIAAKRLCDALNTTERFKADFIDVRLVRETLPSSIGLSGSLSNHKYTNTHFTGEYPGFVRGWLVDLLSKYDFLNVHWASYLISISELQELANRGSRILITMHDFYYSTGGCHYPAGCSGQTLGCRQCPQVDRSAFSIASVANAFAQKKRFLSNRNVHVSAPSNYLIEEVLSSGLSHPKQAKAIRNIYTPLGHDFNDKQNTRKRLLLIADSLSEKRKGMALALGALEQAKKTIGDELEVHVVGKAPSELKDAFTSRKIGAIFHGRIDDHRHLVDVYRNMGLLMTCSYEDNWPNILVEGGAYGVIPVVGAGHGCEEFCDTYNIGRVVNEYSPVAFASALMNQLASFPSNDALHRYAAKVRLQHDIANVLMDYETVLDSIGNTSSRFLEWSGEVSQAKVSENYEAMMTQWRTPPQELLDVEDGPFADSAVNFSDYGLRQRRRKSTR